MALFTWSCAQGSLPAYHPLKEARNPPKTGGTRERPEPAAREQKKLLRTNVYAAQDEHEEIGRSQKVLAEIENSSRRGRRRGQRHNLTASHSPAERGMYTCVLRGFLEFWGNIQGINIGVSCSDHTTAVGKVMSFYVKCVPST